MTIRRSTVPGGARVGAARAIISALSVVGAFALVMSPAVAAEEAEKPELVGLPPETATIDIAPVHQVEGQVGRLVAPVAELIMRTGSVDGAVIRDETEQQERYTLAGDVFFETDSAMLTERARADLAVIAVELAGAGSVTVAVVGHTDSVADDDYNQRLSVARAEAVQQFLLATVPSLQITTEGRGEREPVAVEEGTPEEIAQARALNRRVEITSSQVAG